MTTPKPDRARSAAKAITIIQLVLAGLFGVAGLGVLLFGGDVGPVGGPIALAAAVVAVIGAFAPRLGIFAAAIGGSSAAGYLFLHKLAQDAGPSLCAVNEVFDCDAVNASGPSEVLGVPISLFGLAFYAAVAITSLVGRTSTPRFNQVLTGFGIGAILYTLYLVWQSHQLGLICLFCMAMWAANLLLLVGGLRGLADEGRSLLDTPSEALKSRSLILMGALFLVGTSIGASRWLGTQDTALASIPDHPRDQDLPDAQQLAMLYGKPNGTLRLTGDEPVLGSPDAPYLVVEFADFECGHCASASALLPQIVEKNPDVQVHFKSFPLTGKCNPLIPEENGEWGRCRAAAAVSCAEGQGKGWPMIHLLFDNMGYNETEDLLIMARQLGLDEGLFATCMDDDATLKGVLADAQAGFEVKVEGTPTFFLRMPGQGDFVQITTGVEGLYYLIQAHKAGLELLPPRPIESRY